MMNTDINDLGYIYFSAGKENEPYLNLDIDNKLANSYLGGLCNFFMRFVYYLVKSPWNFRNSLKKNHAILVYGESVNNRNSLLPIIKELGDDNLIDLYNQRQYPKWRQYWYALPHIWDLIKEIRQSETEKKRTIKFFFAKFWVMFGCNKAAGELLDYYNPRIVVMANDHLHFNRALMHEANERGIPTIYVQHASVTEKFPPLCFSYSFLDGEDSYNKYKLKEKSSGKIYLSGGIRFDGINNSKKNLEGKIVIGVAINQIDNETIVKNTCLKLKSLKLGTKDTYVILRPHPQMPFDIWRDWCKLNEISISSAREETSFAFLSRISVLVSNQSSIHLDAAMCHTPTILYKLSSSQLADSYSYVKNGLVKEAGSMEELLLFVSESEHYQQDENAVKYYNCSYGSTYEGQVAKMMADLIGSIPDKVEAFNQKYHFAAVERKETLIVYKAI